MRIKAPVLCYAHTKVVKVVVKRSCEKLFLHIDASGEFLCDVYMVTVSLGAQTQIVRWRGCFKKMLHAVNNNKETVCLLWSHRRLDSAATVVMPSVEGLLVLFVPGNGSLWLWLPVSNRWHRLSRLLHGFAWWHVFFKPLSFPWGRDPEWVSVSPGQQRVWRHSSSVTE